MQKSIPGSALHLVAFSVLLALSAFTANTQAAAFRTTWDPLFNAAFSTTLGWRGSAEITVDDACVTASTTVGFPTGCGTATLDSFELEFYNVNTNAVVASGSGSAPGLPGVSAVSFDGMAIADGLDLASAINVGSFFFGNNNFSFQAFLDFDLSGPSLTLVENCEYFSSNFDCLQFVNDSVNNPPTVTWERIPAPASLALFGIGLAALGLVRRRGKA